MSDTYTLEPRERDLLVELLLEYGTEDVGPILAKLGYESIDHETMPDEPVNNGYIQVREFLFSLLDLPVNDVSAKINEYLDSSENRHQRLLDFCTAARHHRDNPKVSRVLNDVKAGLLGSS